MQFMNNVKFGDVIIQGDNKYILYGGIDHYVAYNERVDKYYRHTLNLKRVPSSDYTIENCLQDYLSSDDDDCPIININGERVFKAKYKPGNVFTRKNNNGSYMIVQDDTSKKYGIMNMTTYVVFPFIYDSIDRLVQEEFNPLIYIKTGE